MGIELLGTLRIDGAPALLQRRDQVVLSACDLLVERARVQARQNTRLRRSLVGVAVLLVAAMVAGVLAYQQCQAARHEERDAALTALTSNAAALRTNRRDLAALLAVEAHRLAPSAATESALFGTFTASPGAVRSVPTVSPSTSSARFISSTW